MALWNISHPLLSFRQSYLSLESKTTGKANQRKRKTTEINESNESDSDRIMEWQGKARQEKERVDGRMDAFVCLVYLFYTFALELLSYFLATCLEELTCVRIKVYEEVRDVRGR